jgi:rSAM/selenodomain-associated transferase 2
MTGLSTIGVEEVGLAVIIPTLNEAEAIARLLAQVVDHAAEVWVVDAGSADRTQQIVQSYRVGWARSAKGRARQLHLGALLSQSEVLVFVHADSVLPDHWADEIRRASRHHRWGRFDVAMLQPGWLLKIVAAMMNFRSRLSAISTGDQVQWVHRSAYFACGGFPDQALMEDVALSRKLKRLGPPANLRGPVGVDARRWLKSGVLRTIGLMWALRLGYWIGVSPRRLASFYRHVR